MPDAQKNKRIINRIDPAWQFRGAGGREEGCSPGGAEHHHLQVPANITRQRLRYRHWQTSPFQLHKQGGQNLNTTCSNLNGTKNSALKKQKSNWLWLNCCKPF